MHRFVIVALFLYSFMNYAETPQPTPVAVASEKEMNCLIDNIYHEARGEAPEGQVAVALVTLNRLAHPAYPNTICGVVYQPKQFSWTAVAGRKRAQGLGKKLAGWAAVEAFSRRQASAMGQAKNVLAATHYHERSIRPSWTRELVKIATIGNHIFYR